MARRRTGPEDPRAPEPPTRGHYLKPCSVCGEAHHPGIGDQNPLEVCLASVRAALAQMRTGKECDCIHNEDDHDKLTGACHYNNILHGPCPCAATPDEMRNAQRVAQLAQRSSLLGQGLLLKETT